MPLSKKRTALEEAEWEDVEGDGTLARELMLQCTLNSVFATSDSGLLSTTVADMPDLFSHGNAPCLPPKDRAAWAIRDGATIRGDCHAAPS